MAGPLVIDATAITALLLGEPAGERVAGALARRSNRCMTALSHFEAAEIIDARKGPDGVRCLEDLLAALRVRVEVGDDELSLRTAAAHRRFGAGRHKASLALGSCSAYALAQATGGVLLYAGGGLGRTDAVSAL